MKFFEQSATLGSFASSWASHDENDLWFDFDDPFIAQSCFYPKENLLDSSLSSFNSHNVSSILFEHIFEDWISSIVI